MITDFGQSYPWNAPELLAPETGGKPLERRVAE